MVAALESRPEFSRLVPLDRLGDGEIGEAIEASTEERAALTGRFGLLALGRLTASLRLGRCRGAALIQVTGCFVAEVTQACVVTLEPVESQLEETFVQLYGSVPKAIGPKAIGPKAIGPKAIGPGAHHVMIHPDEDEPPEPVGPGGIDIGEAVAQQLALTIDPYPRAPGAKLADTAPGGAGGQAVGEGPFADLKALKGGG